MNRIASKRIESNRGGRRGRDQGRAATLEAKPCASILGGDTFDRILFRFAFSRQAPIFLNAATLEAEPCASIFRACALIVGMHPVSFFIFSFSFLFCFSFIFRYLAFALSWLACAQSPGGGGGGGRFSQTLYSFCLVVSPPLSCACGLAVGFRRVPLFPSLFPPLESVSSSPFLR